jgi:programmed cell death 6-interacting protein
MSNFEFNKFIFFNKIKALSSGLYERLSVLFNVAACCSEVASSQQLDQEENLKLAAKYYQLAAGAFTYIRDNSLTTTRNDCTSDMFPETLSFLIAVMLAQAQEVFYAKALKDNMKQNIISKLSAQCSDLYADAMKLLQNDLLKDLQKVCDLF